MADPTLYTLLKNAHTHAGHAIDQLDDALATSASRLLEPKHRNLLKTTRNNLRRQKRVLLELATQAMKIVYPTNPFPHFLEHAASEQEKCGKSPSPQNGQ